MIITLVTFYIHYANYIEHGKYRRLPSFNFLALLRLVVGFRFGMADVIFHGAAYSLHFFVP